MVAPSGSSTPGTSHIYKIAPAQPVPTWPANCGMDQLSAILPVSDLDKSSNFIHMSTASQVPGTLKHFFPTKQDDRNKVYLLRVALTSDLEENRVLRWESPDASICGPRDSEGMFPHLYFDEGEERRLWLRKGEVSAVIEVVSETGQHGWEQGLESVIGDDHA